MTLRAHRQWLAEKSPSVNAYRSEMAKLDTKHRTSVTKITTALLDGAVLIRHALELIEARRAS